MAIRKSPHPLICRDEEEAIEFWRQVLYEYSYSVSFEFTVSPKKLVKDFILFDRIPSGLPAIMAVLNKRGRLTTREQILSGQFYQAEAP